MDPGIDCLIELCGLCLHSTPLCQFFLKKGKESNHLKDNRRSIKHCQEDAKWQWITLTVWQLCLQQHLPAPTCPFNVLYVQTLEAWLTVQCCQYHLGCVGLEQLPQNWVCAACEVSGRGRGGKCVCHWCPITIFRSVPDYVGGGIPRVGLRKKFDPQYFFSIPAPPWVT